MFGTAACQNINEQVLKDDRFSEIRNKSFKNTPQTVTEKQQR